jgi:hypothetical protein
MNEINNLSTEIKDLERLINAWKAMIAQFSEDTFLAFSLPPYEARLLALRQELLKCKEKEALLEAA